MFVDDAIIFVCDYQQNIEEVYSETPTSMAYSANKKSYAMYPVGVYLRDPATGNIIKLAITLVSDDYMDTLAHFCHGPRYFGTFLLWT